MLYLYYIIMPLPHDCKTVINVCVVHSTVVLWLIPIALGGRTQKMHSCLILLNTQVNTARRGVMIFACGIIEVLLLSVQRYSNAWCILTTTRPHSNKFERTHTPINALVQKWCIFFSQIDFL